MYRELKIFWTGGGSNCRPQSLSFSVVQSCNPEVVFMEYIESVDVYTEGENIRGIG